MCIVKKICFLLVLLPIISFGAASETKCDQSGFLRDFVAAYNKEISPRAIGLEDITELEEIVGKGKLGCGVYKISIKDQAPIFCKGSYAGTMEGDNCAYCQQFLAANYVDKSDTTYPQFVGYLGYFFFKGFVTEREASEPMCGLYNIRPRAILMFEAAPGESLLSILAEQPLDENKIRRAGAMVAKFHLHFLVTEDEVFKSFVHGDLHADNVFVAFEPFRVTFIDYDQMAGSFRLGKMEIAAELERFFDQSLKLLAECGVDEDHAWSATKIFAHGYFDEFQAAGYPIDRDAVLGDSED